MNFENVIEEVGGIEITEYFKSQKNIDFDVFNYLKEFNIKLPDSYISFSITYGYAEFIEDVVFTSLDKIPVGYDDGTLPISFIYGWGNGAESLQQTRDALLDQISSEYFVFAEANPGDYLLINQVDNMIYYYQHDADESKSYYLVANSFIEFIHSLRRNKNLLPEDDLEEEWFSDDF